MARHDTDPCRSHQKKDFKMNTDNKNPNNNLNANRDKIDTSKSDVSTSQDSQKNAQSNISQGRTDSQVGQGKLDEKSQQHAKVDPSTDAARKDAK
jgi:hypothetical protein